MGFSVLIPVYKANDPEHLRLALKSIIEQSVRPTEIIIVEDGPVTPEIAGILQEFKITAGGSLKTIKLPADSGLVHALNEGLKQASHELVARMDADDISLYNRFEKQLDFFEKNPDYSLVGGQIEEFLDKKGDISQFRMLPLSYEEIVVYARKRCPFNHPSVMYKRSMLEEVGGYQPFSRFEDYYLWARIIHAGYKVANLPDILLHYRLGPDFVKRRKGMLYFFQEFALLNGMRKMGFLDFWQFTGNIFRRLPLRIMPDFIVKWVYWYFLRK